MTRRDEELGRVHSRRIGCERREVRPPKATGKHETRCSNKKSDRNASTLGSFAEILATLAYLKEQVASGELEKAK